VILVFFLLAAMLAGYAVYSSLSQRHIDAVNERQRQIEGPSGPAVLEESEDSTTQEEQTSEEEAPVTEGEADWVINLRRELQPCLAMSGNEAKICRDGAYLKYCFPDRWGSVPECPETDPFTER
jgi:hypothetical protein